MAYRNTGASVPVDLLDYKDEAGISTTKIVQEVLRQLKAFGKAQIFLEQVLTAKKKKELRRQKKLEKNK